MSAIFGIFAIFKILLIGIIISPNLAAAESKVELKSELKWGADAKSGAPYVFPDAKNPSQLVGFEKDILELIAKRLNRKSVMVQNQWEALIPGLERGDYDVAANGIEITPEREKEILFTIPYYVTFEQLTVRIDEKKIQNFDDLSGKKVGTLKESLAHHLLEKNPKIQVVFYEEMGPGYNDVISGRLDAFFIDHPIALYFGTDPKLKTTGPPVGLIRYGMAVPKKNAALVKELNTAIQTVIDSGELQKVFEKWSLDHPFARKAMGFKENANQVGNSQDSALKDSLALQHEKISFSERMTRYKTLLPLLLKAAIKSMQISIVSMFIAIFFGLCLALARLYGNSVLSTVAQGIVEVLRGTPLLIQLYLIFYGLPYIGVHLSPFVAAVLGLGMNYGAYEAENYRAGIEAVPRSQLEAAQALALSPSQRFLHVIFPQAYRLILPPMTNDFISLIKDSSLVSVITMVELTTIYSQLASTYFDHLGLGVLVAAIYFFMGYPFVRIARRLELNLKKKQ